MEDHRGRPRTTREDGRLADARDRRRDAGEATRESRARESPYTPYPQSLLPRRAEMNGAQLPYPVSCGPLRSYGVEPQCAGDLQMEESRDGGYSCIQPPLLREPDYGADPLLYPETYERLCSTPEYRQHSGEVTRNDAGPGRGPYAPPPPFRGPKIGGAQPSYRVTSNSSLTREPPRPTSCSRSCVDSNHARHNGCNSECRGSRHADHLKRDQLWRDYARRSRRACTGDEDSSSSVYRNHAAGDCEY